MSWNPVVWLSQNWGYIAGWAAFAVLIYRAYIVVNKFASYGSAITTLQLDMESVKSNHLPHIQEELIKVNENISGLRTDVKDGLGNLRDDFRLILSRMP